MTAEDAPPPDPRRPLEFALGPVSLWALAGGLVAAAAVGLTNFGAFDRITNLAALDVVGGVIVNLFPAYLVYAASSFADPSVGRSALLVAFCMMTNMALYAVFGGSLWLGKNRDWKFYGIAAAVVALSVGFQVFSFFQL